MIENSLNETDVLLHQLFDRAARLRSEAIALVYQDRRISFFELQLYVEWMSGYFQTINLQTGQRVALLMENSPKLVISLFGLWRAGGVAVPLEITSDDAELRSQLALAKVSVIVTTPENKVRLDQVLAQAPDADTARSPFTVAVFEDDNIVTLDPKTHGRRTLSEPRKITRVEERATFNGRTPLNLRETAMENLAVIYFQANLEFSQNTHEELIHEAQTMMAQTELAPKDRLICLTPLAQQNNLGRCLIAAIAAGATVVVAETMDWENLEKVFIEESVTVAVGPAALLLRVAKNNSAKLTALRWYFYTDAVLSPEIGERLPKSAGLRIEQLTDTITTGILK